MGLKHNGFVLGIVVLWLKILHVFNILNEALMNVIEVGCEFFGGRSGMRCGTHVKGWQGTKELGWMAQRRASSRWD